MDKQWYVIYTKPRNEKKVADRLDRDGYTVYCPLVRTLRKWSDRKKKVTVPMFTSYVFIFMEEWRKEEIIQDPGVLTFVYWQGKLAIIREREIEAIRKIASEVDDVKVSALNIKKGQMMEIKEGPFKGLLGKITDLDKNLIVIYIQQLGCKIQFKYSKRHLMV